MMKARLLLFTFIGVAIFQSCIKKADFNFDKVVTPVYTGEWAVPLVTSHITLGDILKSQSSAMQTDAQGLVSFVYHINNLSSTTAAQLMKIPDQNLPIQSFSFPTSISGVSIDLSTGKQYSLPFSTDVPLTMANSTQVLDKVNIRTGTISIPISNNFNKATTITIDAPNILNQTTNLKIPVTTITIPANTPNTVANIDVSNCILNLKTVNGVPNTIHFDINMTMQGNASPLLPTYNFSLSNGSTGMRITNIQFSSLYGNLGQFNMNLSQTVDISVFKTNLGGGFQFGPSAISLNINIDNSFGLPIQLNATTFTAHSDKNAPFDVPIKLFGATSPNIIDIGAPTIIGQTKTTTVASTNPNISDAFNISPSKIVLVANALTNPGSPSNLNFVSETSKINMNMDIMLKLFASINNFAFQDTLSFDLKNIDQLESASFRINTTNGFPLGVKLQVFFTDASYNVLDAMFTDPLPDMLKPATVGGSPDYKTVTPTSYQFPDITYDQARLKKIINAKKIILKAVLNTANGGLIKIYNSYYFDSKIAVRAKAKATSSN